jgi:hypothetical protein
VNPEISECHLPLFPQLSRKEDNVVVDKWLLKSISEIKRRNVFNPLGAGG